MTRTSSLRAQHHATRACFLIPGLAIASWAPLVPLAKQRAGLDDASLGLTLLCLGCGSLVAMPMAGALSERLGCRTVLTVASLVICLTLPMLSWVQSPWLLGAMLYHLRALHIGLVVKAIRWIIRGTSSLKLLFGHPLECSRQ